MFTYVDFIFTVDSYGAKRFALTVDSFDEALGTDS